MSTTRGRTSSSGQLSLTVSILLSLMFLLLGTAALVIALAERRSASRQDRLVGVAYAAESGLEFAQAMMLTSPGRSPYRGGALPTLVNGATVTVGDPVFVVAAGDEDVYHLTASARRGRIVRGVEADVAVSADRKRCRILAWKESPTRVPRVPGRR